MANREENIKKINEQLEKLSDEQLEQVAGGTAGESRRDVAFFRALISNFDPDEAGRTFRKYGVDRNNWLILDNDYKMGGQKYPREAALGYVLMKMNYPGYNGNWGDIPYTVNFIREHLGSGIV